MMKNQRKPNGHKKSNQGQFKGNQQTDLLHSSKSSYMFNPAPVYQETLESLDPGIKMKKKKIREKKKLQKRAELLDYVSSEDEAQPQKHVRMQDDDEDYGALEYIDQDLLGYFQVKGAKIIEQSTKVQEATYSEGTLVLGCVSEIGSHGNYVLVSFTRNKKGFISQDHLAINNVNGSSFSFGEYVLGKVLLSQDPLTKGPMNKIQVSLLPSIVNEGRRFMDITVGSLIVGIPISQDEFGYQVRFDERQHGNGSHMGFLKTEQSICLNRSYLLEVTQKDIKQKIITCTLPSGLVVQSHDQLSKRIQKNLLEPKWAFLPGTLWDCLVVKLLTGGLLLRIEKLGILGYVFDDYTLSGIQENQKVKARLISFDYHLRNLQFSMMDSHQKISNYELKFKIGKIFNAIRVERALYGGSYLVTPLEIQEEDKEQDQSKKTKKKLKLMKKQNEQDIIQTGPLSFIHSSQLWITEAADEELYQLNIINQLPSQTKMKIGNIVKQQCRIKEVNYFDHCCMGTMKPSQMTKQQITISDITPGQYVSGIVKSILKNEQGSKILVSLAPGLQGIIPHNQQSDQMDQMKYVNKLQIGARIKSRVLRVEEQTKSITLTLKPMLMQKDIKIIAQLSDLQYCDQIYGFVSKELQNGNIFINLISIKGVCGLLSLKEIEASGHTKEDLQLGQTVKVYVKYVNVSEKKLLLTLRKLDSPEDNEIISSFREQRQKLNETIDQLQLQQLDQSQLLAITGKVINYKQRKTTQTNNNFIILDSFNNKQAGQEIQKHSAVLVKEQGSHIPDEQIQQQMVQHMKDSGALIRALIIESHGACLVSSKFVGECNQHPSQGSIHWGYVIEINIRYILVKLPLITLSPTGIIHLDVSKQLEPIHYMQSILVKVRSVQHTDGKTKLVLEPQFSSELYNTTLAMSYFNNDRQVFQKSIEHQVDLFSKLRVGNVLKARVTLVKSYGVVTDIHGATGFIMNQNLIGGREYIINEDMVVQVLDIDYVKNVVDLREVQGKKITSLEDVINANQIQVNQINYFQSEKKQIQAQILLVKDQYSIVKVKNTSIIAFVWNPKSLYKQEDQLQFSTVLKNLIIVNQSDIQAGNKKHDNHQLKSTIKINYIPLLVTGGEIHLQDNEQDNELVQPSHDKKQQSLFQQGEHISTTFTQTIKQYAYTELPNDKKGRIHKTQFPLIKDKDNIFGYSTDFDSLTQGKVLDCFVFKLKSKKSPYIDLTALDHLPRQISTKPEKDVGKELPAFVTKIRNGEINPIQVEVIGGQSIKVSGWGLLKATQADQLNELDQYVKLGEMVNIRLALDTQGKLQGYRVGVKDVPVELYSLQTFRVVSHHNTYMRVQMKDNQYASIDITDISDQWLPGIFKSIYPVGKWGYCRLISSDVQHGFWGSCRSNLLNEKEWQVCFHPTTSSQLNYKNQIQPYNAPFDLRNDLFKNPGHTIKQGDLILGYITAIIDHGVFVKFGQKNSMVVFVQTNELSDTNTKNIILGRPVLALVTKSADGKFKGTLRYSVISKTYSTIEPKAGDIIEGNVTEIKNDRALIKLQGYLLNAELDKKNSEGADTEKGWWAEKLTHVGEHIKGIVLQIKQLKQGEKVVKISNIKELVEQKESTQEKKETSHNQDAIEVFLSLQAQTNQYITNNAKSTNEDLEEGEVKYIQKEATAIDEEEVSNDEDLQDDQEENEDFKNQTELLEMIDESILNSRAEYEKSILADPNSSELWVKYISFVLENESIQSARGVMERALRVINFRDETERLNLWTSFLNMEFHFGTEDKLILTFKNGCNTCNPKKLHLKLIEIYRKASKLDLMVELARSMVNKYKQSSKCWNELLHCLMEWHQHSNQKFKDNQIYSLKENLQRAFQCLNSSKHTQLLIHYGRLQFQFNQIEQGKTTFDALLQKYPKRTDILNQYVDLCAKYCSQEVTRQIFERSLEVKLNPHKIKFLFKKWLEFESQQGSQQNVQNVQQKAQEWVQMYKQRQGMEEEEQSNEDDE